MKNTSETLIVDLGLYVCILEKLRPDLSSTQKMISKFKRKFENGGVLRLRHGGTTFGHRAGENHLAGEDEGGRLCS